MEQGDDPYRILGVSTSASEADIKTAYRKLALKEHPDRKTTPAEREAAVSTFAKLSNAYELLKDPEQRRDYNSLQRLQHQRTGTAQGYDRRNVHVCFHSPYEVFKRDFEERMGFPYPGSHYDFTGATAGSSNPQSSSSPSKSKQKRLESDRRHTASSSNHKSSSNNNNHSSNNHSRSTPYSSSSSSPSSPTQRSSQPYSSSSPSSRESVRPSTDLVVQRDHHKNHSKSSSHALTKRDSNNKSSSKPQHSSASSSKALVPSRGREGDNRPLTMSTTERQIRHADGTVETITETRMERPDGSMETVCVSDRADKRPNWAQKQNGKSMVHNNPKPNDCNSPLVRAATTSPKNPTRPPWP